MTRSAPRGSRATSPSPTRTVPGGASQSLARRSPSVDLPLPVGPTTATVSPAPTEKLTPRSAGGRPAYANVRISNRMAGAGGEEGSEGNETGLRAAEPLRSSHRTPADEPGQQDPATT